MTKEGKCLSVWNVLDDAEEKEDEKVIIVVRCEFRRREGKVLSGIEGMVSFPGWWHAGLAEMTSSWLIVGRWLVDWLSIESRLLL